MRTVGTLACFPPAAWVQEGVSEELDVARALSLPDEIGFQEDRL